ncbi:FadR/GntR family transcriptional regulator [Poseidonocella sp. HB161398]|uniref:FadR/GntR family transcriptional regulator n=1 Tax=Poseidonocella sp. HB161398 TaxID=2320855 RepID=UPI001108C774|nr:FadR/GntR family transcriptional regulator [Poseidonocella sp. HB161398]
MPRRKVHDPVAEAALRTLSPIAKTADMPLSDKAYEEILRLIVSGAVKPGQSLPTEAEFCAAFAVSRTVVREAMSRLKTDGVISSSPGRKCEVLKQPAREVLSAPEAVSVAEVQRFLEYRELIEREAAALAARRAEPSDLKRLRKAHADQQAAFAANDVDVRHDLEFHYAVLRAAHNNFLWDSMAALRRTYAGAMTYARQTMPKNFAARSERVMEEHAAILRAIEARDAEAARNYMAYHLQRGKERIFAHERDPALTGGGG